MEIASLSHQELPYFGHWTIAVPGCLENCHLMGLVEKHQVDH